MTSYSDIVELLATSDTFTLTVAGKEITVRKSDEDSWGVFFEGERIGSFQQRTKNRATFYESEIASEPGVTNWVSDDVDVLISRMLTLRG